MAKFPLTNQRIEEFVKATSYQTTPEKEESAYAYDGKEWKDTKGANWQHPRGSKSDLKSREMHPVVSVS